mmetsp:Transcript_22242/g.31298  ORF Transcript_22242/g.31298 Transcript_22242/m.31298 type:complete len:81 (-) Transcript_22242:391-633(-)
MYLCLYSLAWNQLKGGKGRGPHTIIEPTFYLIIHKSYVILLLLYWDAIDHSHHRALCYTALIQYLNKLVSNLLTKMLFPR